MYTRLALNSQDYEVTTPLIERHVCHLFSATEPGSAAVASTWQRWKRTQLISPPFTTLHRFYPGQHQPPASSRDLCSACSALATEAWKWGSVARGAVCRPLTPPPPPRSGKRSAPTNMSCPQERWDYKAVSAHWHHVCSSSERGRTRILSGTFRKYLS